MNTAKTPENPIMQTVDNNIKISYKGQNHEFNIEDIQSVYLKKKKSAYFPSFMGTMFTQFEKQYKLYIRTDDTNLISIKVHANERQHFINLISYIRNAKSNRIVVA